MAPVARVRGHAALELFVEGEIMNSTLWYSTMPSPIGILTLVSDGHALTRIQFEEEGSSAQWDWARDDARLIFARTQLEEYFAGRRTRFDLPLAMHGTPFQQRVWKALAGVPFGA